MDDEEYKKLWAMIDKAHIRIGRLESDRQMLMRAVNGVISVCGGESWEQRYAVHSAKRLLETMKGE